MRELWRFHARRQRRIVPRHRRHAVLHVLGGPRRPEALAALRAALRRGADGAHPAAHEAGDRREAGRGGAAARDGPRHHAAQHGDRGAEAVQAAVRKQKLASTT